MSEKKNEFHIPVLLDEVMEFLKPERANVLFDLTVATGGHSSEILKRLPKGAVLLGMDFDEKALAVAKKRLTEISDSFRLFQGNFVDFDEVLQRMNIRGVDGFLLDVGTSTFQLGDAERGFSFNLEGPLDMRMDEEMPATAYDVVNTMEESQLADVIYAFGEERKSRRIARAICQYRKKHPVRTTTELKTIIERVFGRTGGRIHPATRTFQALRIYVNKELENLQTVLNKAPKYLNKDGRIVVISFHSLEDRIVKNTFRSLAKENVLEVLTKKVMQASPEEQKRNRKSRSAKLRAARRM